MAGDADYISGDEERVPLKLMLFVGVIAILGCVFFLVALAIDRKPIDPNIDPSNPTAFEQTDADIEETPDLWVQKKPPRFDPPFSTPGLVNPLQKPIEMKPLFPDSGKKEATSKPS